MRPRVAVRMRRHSVQDREYWSRLERSQLRRQGWAYFRFESRFSLPRRFPGRQKPSQFRSVSEAYRGLRTEFRPFSRVRRPNSHASRVTDRAGAFPACGR